MTSTSGGAGMPSGGPGGSAGNLISKFGQLSAHDMAGDLHLLQQALSTLKTSELDTLHKMLKQGASMGGGVGSQPVVAQPAGINISEMAFIVLKAALAGSQDDLHTIMQGVKDMQKRRSLRQWGLMGASLLVLLALGTFLLKQNPGPPDNNPGPPEINPAPPDLAAAGLNPACSIHISSPTSSDQIPLAGQLRVAWSAVPAAASYDMKMTPPASFSVPWLFHVNGTAKNVFMENFPAAGDYELSVSALDASGATLCSDTFRFKKAAYAESSGKNKEPGGGCSSSGIMVVCP